MKLNLFGCKDTTLHVARHLAARGHQIALTTISPEVGAKNEVAGYCDLTEHSDLFDSIFITDRYALDSDMAKAHFADNSVAKLGFAIGWQRLIPGDILDRFEAGVFGMHGSARDLPFGKGRSPMNWALIEGREFFHTNLFRYQVGVDDGPVAASACFSINDTDTAETLHYKNMLSMMKLIDANIEAIAEGVIEFAGQADGGSFYPKRNPQDGMVDWRDDVRNIDRLIRAVAPPFAGGLAVLEGKTVTLQRAAVFYTDIEAHPFRGIAEGTILDVFPSGKFLVRCGGGALLVHEYEAGEADIATGKMFTEAASPFARFKRNEYGYFDV